LALPKIVVDRLCERIVTFPIGRDRTQNVVIKLRQIDARARLDTGRWEGLDGEGERQSTNAPFGLKADRTQIWESPFLSQELLQSRTTLKIL